MILELDRLRGELRENEPMSRHTSWRAGGPARRYYRPADLDDLALFLSLLDEAEPVYWTGLGSNLLVRDGGWRGTVIATHGTLGRLEHRGGGRVYAGAGVACAKLARRCGRWGLGGADFFAGIPGTVGGALAMNAGAFGGETWDCVAAVEVIDRRGALHRRPAGAYRTGYRQVQGPEPDSLEREWFVAAELRFGPGADGDAGARIRDLLARRSASQPTGVASCGSVFRNPPGDHAARLIEACGLKGRRIGNAGVSEKHANFIVNLGKARAAEIEALILEVQAEVARRFGVRLEPEVRIVGEAE
ncbi:MAG TPA: UDP-N-acetylmuramate dehydrogenase [Gammaproteobacteria bacterium]|nr:UDP-N-acetylmuramate dehydrogenase [Gammaproteobacteria bacterium]